MMSSGPVPLSRQACRSSSRPLRSPSMMRRARRSSSGSARSSLALEAFIEAASTPEKMSRKRSSGSYPSRRRS